MLNNTRLGIKAIALIDFLFGIFIMGWFVKACSNIAAVLNAVLSSCPCSITAKIAILVVILLIVLFIKTGIQVFQLNPKGRNDHISISSMGIFILLFPVIFGHHEKASTVICGLFIAYLAWSIIYLNSPNIKELFKERL